MSITARLLGSAVSHWGDDPWAGGSWSLIGRHGSPQDRITLGTPVGDRLRIAGEATHPTRAGMTHGAYEQGLAAATWAINLGHRRVAVIGAGMAGLAASRALTDSGLAAPIWEARDRIGGRTAGADVAGGAFDLGANWLQQYDANLLARLAEHLGLTTIPTDFTNPLTLPSHPGLSLGDDPSPGGGPASGGDLSASGDLDGELRKRLAGAAEGASVGDVLDAWLRDPGPWTAAEIRRFVDAEIVMDTGVPLSWLSARHGFEPGVGEGDRWIVGGYRLLTTHLAAGLDIRLQSPVQHVRINPDGVVLTSGDLTEHADAVIVTAPVPVLAADTITFDPPLPESHRLALSHLGAGRVEKVILRFDERFWPEHGYYRVHGPSDTCISEWLDATAADGLPTLVGLFAGPWLDTLWTGPDPDIAARATAVIRAATT
ncbi:flavin monoamine oxidase family protein [Actinoplanes awajinensis]|uniref:Amine oxidase n=1 Tax=Actinoplanes awajinensis subsp. mycoplanecinus TaxID=135947 RepID=A0A0X3V9K5_9ACTN|nr:NAD(P)/FAD-dependent oxidoreductase [Actinoplanes awajinensis]KUL41097.1 amine oxidase [Actinoplanes awajinensis subsp. mycoplanecinus]